MVRMCVVVVVAVVVVDVFWGERKGVVVWWGVG